MTTDKPLHTPGPWSVVNATDVFTELGAENYGGIEADGNDGWQIADCSVGFTFVDGGNERLSYSEQSANARLIAAAPELYEALQAIIDEYHGDMLSDYCEKAERTLAKARGES